MQQADRRDHRPAVHHAGGSQAKSDPAFLWRTFRVLGLAVLAGFGVLLALHDTQAFLLAFAGILVAVLLHAPSDRLAEHTPLTPRWALAGVVGLIPAAFPHRLAVPSLIRQAGKGDQTLPHFRGGVLRTRHVRVPGPNKSHLAALVQTAGGRTITVDLGTAGELGTQLKEGDQVAVRGRGVSIGDRIVLLGYQLRAGDRTYNVNRAARMGG